MRSLSPAEDEVKRKRLFVRHGDAPPNAIKGRTVLGEERPRVLLRERPNIIVALRPEIRNSSLVIRNYNKKDCFRSPFL